jgi:hypothetical protein|tara:strand:- start:1922 stop:2068 length:147 start_codon:yes stop_codon:yes gene_type:complete
MLDSLKTITAGMGGVGVWWIDGISPIIQLLISLFTLAYICLKVMKELK